MNTTSAKILLLSVFMARGTSFIFSKSLMNDMTPMSVLAVRFSLAFLILAAIFFKKLKVCSKDSLRGGVILGLLYTICMVFEMFGLRLIDSGVSALIENMAIVLVPVIVAIATKTPPKKSTILCAMMAVIGVGFLSISQLKLDGGMLGILLTVGALMMFALCIITTEKVSGEGDPITIGVIQMGTMGVLSLIGSLLMADFCLPGDSHQWIMMLFLVLICSCFGFTFQPLGQKYVSAETAAVFTVVNPLVASILGIVVGGEAMSVSKLIGYVLILGALIIYNCLNRD